MAGEDRQLQPAPDDVDPGIRPGGRRRIRGEGASSSVM